MMYYWAKYRESDGAIVMIGHSSSVGEMHLQADRRAGLAVIEADGPTILAGIPSQETYLEAVKVAVAASIDARAEQLLAPALAAGPGIAAIYLAKEAEARQLLAGSSHIAPILEAEAAALAMPIGDLAGMVVSKADASRRAMADVEARRRTAKAAVAVAANVLEVVRAVEGAPSDR